MTDRELLETIVKMIRQHLCDHLDRFIHIRDGKETLCCKWCGKESRQ